MQQTELHDEFYSTEWGTLKQRLWLLVLAFIFAVWGLFGAFLFSTSNSFGQKLSQRIKERAVFDANGECFLPSHLLAVTCTKQNTQANRTITVPKQRPSLVLKTLEERSTHFADIGKERFVTKAPGKVT